MIGGPLMKKVIDILQEMHPQFDFLQSEDFIKDGYIDSFDLTKLIVELEDVYDVELSGDDVAAENFRNVTVICQMLQRHGVLVEG
jgi:acyl carrier protein